MRAALPSLILLACASACDAPLSEEADAVLPRVKDQGVVLEPDAGSSEPDAAMDSDSGSAEDAGPCGATSPRAGELTACGVLDRIACAECAGVDECGRGASNFVPIVNCPNCPARVDSHLCESGLCRRMGSAGALRVRFSVAASAAGAQSFITAAFNPEAASGERLRCEQLVSSCMRTDNPALNATNVAFQLFSAPADPGLIYVTTFGAEVGEDRLVLLVVTSERSGGGRVLGAGCVEGVRLDEATPAEVVIEVR